MVAANVNFRKSPVAVTTGRDLDMNNKEDKKLHY
jgi:hypothetical protein